MSITVHRIENYTVQFLTKRMGERARTSVIVRLYDDDDEIRATVVFKRFGTEHPPKPTGDYDSQICTVYFDSTYYSDYVQVLRVESPIYLKLGWTRPGPSRVLSQVSMDTKKEIIGEYLEQSDPG